MVTVTQILLKHFSDAAKIDAAALEISQSPVFNCSNLEWLITNATHGDVSGDIDEHLAKMILAAKELRAIRRFVG